MTNYVKVREVVSYRIRKGKKYCRKVLRGHFKLLLLCWFITTVVAFAAWFIYVFIDFAGFFLGLKADFFAAFVGLSIFLPLFFGNINVSDQIIKGRKADVYMLFDNYFSFFKFWRRLFVYAIVLSPGWILTLCVAVFSKEPQKILPFLKGDILVTTSVFLEIVMVVLLFVNVCKSVYFFSEFNLSIGEREFFSKCRERYNKKKKYFRKYVLSHIHLFIILVLAKKMPLYIAAIVYMVILGYLILSVSSFSRGFGVKFKKYKFKRIEKKV